MPIIDKGWKRFRKAMNAINGHHVRAGHIASQVGQQLVLIAAANHQGARVKGKQHIPKRPYHKRALPKMLPLMRGKNGQVATLFGAYQLAAIRGSVSWRDPFKGLGGFLRDQIKDAIRDFDAPGNKPRTIAEKGFDDPLTHTGRLQGQTNYKIG